MSQSPSTYKAAPEIASLADFLADPVSAAVFPDTILRFCNQRWAEAVGLGDLTEDQWIAHFGRFAPLPGNLPQPLALRYHGHQFRVYNPNIGDGRGFLFAQLRDGQDRLLDLGTKGSGQTPHSRFGDGRLTLKGGVREILATEMLEALGVITSKTFSLIETGESLVRGDEPSPTRSAVMVRLSHGHIRIGTFQRLAALEQTDEMQRLVDWALTAYFGGAQGDEAPAVQLMHHAVAGVADMCGRIMAAGFVHGVLNSDNINITGESFDYGPWRFLPEWNPGFTAAYFDEQGLYAFGRQPEAMHWDLAQLAISLRQLVDAPPLIAALERFPDIYRAAFVRNFLWRLGFAPGDGEADLLLVAEAEQALIASKAPVAAFFHDWMGRTDGPPNGYAEDLWSKFRALAAKRSATRERSHPHWSGPPCGMTIEEVEAIWAPIADGDDWSALKTKVTAIRAMGEALGPAPA